MVGLLDNDALTGNSLQKPGNEAYDIVHVCMVSKIKLKKKKNGRHLQKSRISYMYPLAVSISAMYLVFGSCHPNIS